MTRPLVVAVVGPGDADEVTLDRAAAAGAAVGEAGADLVCGGLGGVMAAACRGAKSVGGRTIGILPGADRAEANPDVDVVVPTGLGEARNAVVVRAADVVVAVAGGWGTLSEIALAVRMGRPVVGVGTWQLRPPDGSPDPLLRSDESHEAVTMALRAVGDVRG